VESLDNITETIEQALPVPVRMDADERYTGRGVTVAFLDSGFYANKDLTEPDNLILDYHNIF
jgi:serine protease AprX